ncbi:MAG TPA: N-6 DNA methylase [Gemmatimonas sp.]|nr:N-6 DNA methylase [Gemmatimonas sp.]
MLTLRAAARLLAQADSLHSTAPLVQLLGFPTVTPPVQGSDLLHLGLADLVDAASVARGADSLRLLVASLPASDLQAGDPREVTRKVCVTLARNAPTRLWCVIALDHDRRSLCIATVTASPNGPRVAALRVDRDRVVDSDADTLRALAAVSETHGALRHGRFTDILRRDALSTRFYRGLQATVATMATTARGTASLPERRELALLCASRCLFLAFLEAKGWLDGDRNFLLRHATTTLELGGRIHDRLLRPLFFGTLNTPLRKRAPAARAFGGVPFLNGGLFAPTPLERSRASVRFTDDALVALIGDLIDRYRFTAHEDSAAWSEAAVDPEMLGRAFECLMADDERRGSGSFYTPPLLVDQVVRDALAVALPHVPPDALGSGEAHAMTSAQRAETLAAIDGLRVLDPACGSGAFLVHTLEHVAALAAQCGDHRPTHELRRQILTNSIFGVDRNPVAVWLCELRLWLSVVIECPFTDARNVPPLPNLDHHVRCGDSLAGGDFQFAPAGARRLRGLRKRYTRATGHRKLTLAAALDREERARAVAEVERRLDAVSQSRRESLAVLRTRDLFGSRRTRTSRDLHHLQSIRARQRELRAHRQRLTMGSALPFRFATYFADVASSGGFTLVIGNPPWVRPHALPAAERLALRAEFVTVRHASWQQGALRAGAGTGFAAQADLSVAFVERSARLLASDGTLALLLPAKLWRTLAGGGVRRLLAADLHLRTIRDWSDAPSLFDAAVYPSLVVAQRRHSLVAEHATHAPHSPHSPHASPAASMGARPIKVVVNKHESAARFTVRPRHLSLDGDPAAPWILLPPRVRATFEALRNAGTPLGDSHIGRPTLGVKCGLNAAFLVQALESDDELATIFAYDRTGTIERQLLRPVLRGEDIIVPRNAAVAPAGNAVASTSPPTIAASPDHRIIWTHGPDGLPLAVLPPGAARWLSVWRRQLEGRGDARRSKRWWTLFRTEAARHDAPRVVWADIGRQLRTRVLQAGDPTVPLNSCYVLRTPSDLDAWALDALLTSPLCGAWLDTLAEPARGGFRRFLGWTIATLPVPSAWNAVRSTLAAIGEQRALGTAVDRDLHTHTVASAYGLTLRDVKPLLDWHRR